ncbi:MAG: DUF2325 domain-containing protein [Pseudomonadota bacterium]
MAAQAPTLKTVSRRLKLWELEEKHHCPVIGTCLTLEEIRKLARKHGFVGRAIDAYRLHVEAVSISCERNAVSEAMHKQLDRKYALALRAFEKCRTADDVLALWQAHFERGEVAGPMWAAMTHKAGSPECRQQIYADVHMLSHQVGAGQAADLRRLQWLEGEQARLTAQLRADEARHARGLAEKNARIQELERAVADTWQRAQAAHPLRERLAALEHGVAFTALARKLVAATAEAERQRARAGELEQRLAELAPLADTLESVTRERDAMERLWASESAPMSCDHDCARCPSPLKGRCVLCVGGRTPLLPQYRQLAERLGVRLIHHDGGKEEALSRLPALLASSDAVVCPTDCVGHLAYYQVKQHCKQAGKPCVLVKSSGVASFAAALTRLAEGRAEIQPD